MRKTGEHFIFKQQRVPRQKVLEAGRENQKIGASYLSRVEEQRETALSTPARLVNVNSKCGVSLS